MSIRALNWATKALDEFDLGSLERLALVILAYCHNEKTDACFPSYQTLARRMGCSRTSAIKAVKGLQRSGLIQVNARRDGNRQGSNQYALFRSPADTLRVNPSLLSKRASG